MWDIQLAQLGAYISLLRYNYTKKLDMFAKKLYEDISEGRERLELEYYSTVYSNLEGRKDYAGEMAEEGCHVDVLFTGRESSMTEECRLQAQIDKNLGINLFTEIPEKEYTVIIDAIFGVGLCREVAGHYRDVIGWMNRQTAQKVAVDIPSGICSATGKMLLWFPLYPVSMVWVHRKNSLI